LPGVRFTSVLRSVLYLLARAPKYPGAITVPAAGTWYNFNIYLFLLRKAFFIIETFHLSSFSPFSTRQTLFSLFSGEIYECVSWFFLRFSFDDPSVK
jgi:hypothetical protein